MSAASAELLILSAPSSGWDALAVAVMTATVAIAAAWPAFRATRVQPVDVLRAE